MSVLVGWLKAVELGSAVCAGGAVGVKDATTIEVGDDVSVAAGVGEPGVSGVADPSGVAEAVAPGVADVAGAAVGETPGWGVTLGTGDCKPLTTVASRSEPGVTVSSRITSPINPMPTGATWVFSASAL